MAANRKEGRNGNTELAKRLEQFRLENDLTYRKLAALIGNIHFVTVQRFIESDYKPGKRTLFKFQRFMEGISAHS